jgi:hypothetical protein
MIAPVESCTVPEIVPLITCAEAGGTNFPVSNGAIKHANIVHKKIRFDFELHPFRMVLELSLDAAVMQPLSSASQLLICEGWNTCRGSTAINARRQDETTFTWLPGRVSIVYLYPEI